MPYPRLAALRHTINQWCSDVSREVIPLGVAMSTIACAYLAARHRANWLPSQQHSLFSDHCTLCGQASSPSTAVRPLEREPWRARMRSTVDGETHPPVPNTSSGERACDATDRPRPTPRTARSRGLSPPEDAVDRIAPGGWSSRRLVVPRCRQHRTRCRSSLSVGPLWLRCRRTELAFGRLSDRLSTRTRCRPDSALCARPPAGR